MPAPAQVHVEVMVPDRAQHITAYAYGTVDKSQGVLELLSTPCADRRTGSTWTFIAPQVLVDAMAFWSHSGKRCTTRAPQHACLSFSYNVDFQAPWVTEFVPHRLFLGLDRTSASRGSSVPVEIGRGRRYSWCGPSPLEKAFHMLAKVLLE